MTRACCQLTRLGWVIGLFALSLNGLCAEETPVTQKQWLELQRQNELLQQQVRKQQQLIESLSQKVSSIQNGSLTRENEHAERNQETAPANKAGSFWGLGKVHLTGEGGLALFHSESKGPAPNAEFRLDEARLFIEAPIWKEVYLFSELNITTREDPDYHVQLGELYLDFENLSRFWNRDNQLNLRVGRFYIPFGEEYQTRYAIANPLISHSISDTWGVDEGVEIYGCIFKVQYALAVQNGGHPSWADYNIDKSIALRIGYDPARWLHVSASAMRTGALSVTGDGFSELWFGNGFIRSLGPAGTTKTFQANLLEADVNVHWSKGYLKGAGGYLKYDDDGTPDTQREVYYYYLEGLQRLIGNFYAAARWSQVLASKGFPVVGDGSWMDYFYGTPTQDLWRLSLGLGYRFSPNLLLKADYTFNQGKELGGEKRTHENMVAAEVAFKF